MADYYVYKHTLPKEVSGKCIDMVYIRITSQQPERRWANGLGYTYNSYFYRAIQKYGWDNFKHEILFSDLTLSQASQKEIELIHFYDSTNRSKGYNFQTGGANGYHYSEDIIEKIKESHSGENNGMYGKKHSESSKKLMSDFKKKYFKNNIHPMKGKCHSEKTKYLISNAQKINYKKNGSPLKGTHLSDETKIKLSESAKKRYKNPQNNPFYGKHHSKETKTKLSIQAKERFKDPTQNPNYGNRKRVVCLDTNEIFNSANDVCEKYGMKLPALYAACRKGSLCKGLRFQYLVAGGE